ASGPVRCIERAPGGQIAAGAEAGHPEIAAAKRRKLPRRGGGAAVRAEALRRDAKDRSAGLSPYHHITAIDERCQLRRRRWTWEPVPAGYGVRDELRARNGHTGRGEALRVQMV